MRFLIARKFNESASLALIQTALEWRERRQPSRLHIDPGMEFMSREGATGKIYVSGMDQWGRPVIVFDNTVQVCICLQFLPFFYNFL